MTTNEIRSKQILSLYKTEEPTIIKGRGKEAMIGEVRIWNDQKWVKHADGWVHLDQKTGKATIEKEGGKQEIAQQHHIDHARNVLNKDIKIEDITGYKAIDTVLAIAEPFLQELINYKKERFAKDGMTFTQNDQEYFEMSLISDLVTALSKRINKTDEISDIQLDTSKGVIAINCSIIRDGHKNYFSTRMIVAQGTVQTRHYRYIIDSSLPNLSSSTALDKIKAKQNKIKDTEKFSVSLKQKEDALVSREKDLEKLISTTREDSDIEIAKNRTIGGKNVDYKNVSWESLHDSDKSYYKTFENFKEKLKTEQDENWARIKNMTRSAKGDINNIKKQIEKEKAKLASL